MLDFDQILAYQILAKLKQIKGGWGGALPLIKYYRNNISISNYIY